MEKVLLKAEVREDFGKGNCKKMRREGRIPAVVYKEGKNAVSIWMDTRDLWKALHTEAGENAIITMDLSDGDKASEKTVIVQDVQLDPVSDNFLHVDFHEISLKEKLKVKVPVTAKGDAVGVTEEEGVLAQVIWELEVECMPTNIPEHIIVHVDELHIGDGIHVKDIEPVEGVIILEDPELVVVSVQAPKAEEEPEAEEAIEGEGEEPEVIKKGKKEEGEEGEEAAEVPPKEEKSGE